MTTHCPACKAELWCPCTACREQEPPGLTKAPYYQWKDGEIIVCPVCGHEAHVDAWMESA